MTMRVESMKKTYKNDWKSWASIKRKNKLNIFTFPIRKRL